MATTTEATERGGSKARPKRRRTSVAMKPRGVLLRIHRWLSLVIALWVVVQGLTGAVLVFDDQIHAWSRPELFKKTDGADVGPARVAEVARKAEPKGRLTSVQLPAMQNGVYAGVVSFAAPGQQFGPQRLVYVDPGTGKVNGVRDPDVGFVHWVTRLHDSLLQDEVIGIRGRTIVAWLGAIAIVILLTGFYIWYFPGLKRWAGMFKPRKRGRTPLIRRRNLHRLVGVLSFPILLVVLITGINLQFPEKGREVWYKVTPGADQGTRNPQPPPRSKAPTTGGGAAAKPLTLDQARDRVEALTSGRVQSISVANGPTGAFSARVTEGWDPSRGPRGRGGNVTIYIDQFSGEQLREVKPQDFSVASQAYEYWAFPVHIGSAFGFVGRLAWLLAGFGAAALSLTGVSMWLLRRRSRARRRAVMHEAVPAMPAALVDEAEHKADILPVPAGTVVVRQGDAAEFFYVVLEGEFDVHVDDVYRTTLPSGTSFGEIGLLETGIRTATVTAKTEGEVLVLPIEDLRKIVDRAEAQGVDLHTASAEWAAQVTGRPADSPPPTDPPA